MVVLWIDPQHGITADTQIRALDQPLVGFP